MLNFLSWCAYVALFLAYPGYQSTQAVRKPLRATLTHWLLYWIAFGGFLVSDTLFDGIFVYNSIRNISLGAMLSPLVASKFRSYILLGLARDVDKHLGGLGIKELFDSNKHRLSELLQSAGLQSEKFAPLLSLLALFTKNDEAEEEAKQPPKKLI